MPIGGVHHHLMRIGNKQDTLRRRYAAVWLLVAGLTSPAFASPSAEVPGREVLATLSRRGVRPGESAELVITVRTCSHPVIRSIDRPTGIRIRALRSPQRLRIGSEEVWLFRYRVILD